MNLPEIELIPTREDELTQLFTQPRHKRPRGKGVSTSSMLLNVHQTQFRLISWLHRRKQATLAEITEGLQGKLGPEVNIQEVLEELIQAGQIVAKWDNQEVSYRVALRPNQALHEARNTLWSKVDQDKIRFLYHHPLLAGLELTTVVEFADELESVYYQAGDVVIWQGAVSENFYLVQSGALNVQLLVANLNESRPVAYIGQGEIFGEYPLLLGQDVPASATVSVLSNTHLLVLPHRRLEHYLENHPQLLRNLSKLLVRRLLQTTTLQKRSAAEEHLVVVFGMGLNSGKTMLGTVLAQQLGVEQATVYAEYPNLQGILNHLQIPRPEQNYLPFQGYHLAFPEFRPDVPPHVRITLFYDELSRRYPSVVIALPGRLNDTAVYLLERADQVVLISSPEPEEWQALEAFHGAITKYINPEKTTIFNVVNRSRPEHTNLPKPERAEFDVLYQPHWSNKGQVSEGLKQVAQTIVGRIGRGNQITLFIPTTVATDQATDTSVYVQKALALLGSLFGGATCTQAQGVWNSQEVGLVGEVIYLVRSYATKEALDQHLSQVVQFMEQTKVELAQEAMALEVNKKLILI